MQLEKQLCFDWGTSQEPHKAQGWLRRGRAGWRGSLHTALEAGMGSLQGGWAERWGAAKNNYESAHVTFWKGLGVWREGSYALSLLQPSPVNSS